MGLDDLDEEDPFQGLESISHDAFCRMVIQTLGETGQIIMKRFVREYICISARHQCRKLPVEYRGAFTITELHCRTLRQKVSWETAEMATFRFVWIFERRLLSQGLGIVSAR